MIVYGDVSFLAYKLYILCIQLHTFRPMQWQFLILCSKFSSLELYLSLFNIITFFIGRLCHLSRGILQYSTSTIEEPVKPPVEVKYSQLLIDGQFVDAVSGNNLFVYNHSCM